VNFQPRVSRLANYGLAGLMCDNSGAPSDTELLATARVSSCRVQVSSITGGNWESWQLNSESREVLVLSP